MKKVIRDIVGTHINKCLYHWEQGKKGKDEILNDLIEVRDNIDFCKDWELYKFIQSQITLIEEGDKEICQKK